MEPEKKTINRYLLGCIGLVTGFLVIYYGFEEVSIPDVIKGKERISFYTGLAIFIASAAFCLIGRKR